MKFMKKVLAVMVAVLAICLVATPAFASSITINQNPSGGTAGGENYVAYKIFDVTKTGENKGYKTTDANLGPGTKEGFAYTISRSSAWVSVLQSTKGQTYFTLTPAEGNVYVVELKDGYNTEAGAREIAEWLGTMIPSEFDEDVDRVYPFTSVDEEGQPRTIEVDDGYYLVTSSLGTRVILATTDVEINEKNEYVTDSKVVDKQSVTVGERATYYVKVYLPASIDTGKTVTVHDVLAKSETASFLTFNNDVEVWTGIEDPGSTAAEYRAKTYEALTDSFTVKTTGLSDNCDFEIEIKPDFDSQSTADDLAGHYIVFKYTATLHSEAAADTDYPNTEYSTYSDYTTTEHIANVKTYDFEFTKVDGEAKLLDGAEFELRPTAEGDPIAFIKEGTLYKKADSDDIADPDVQTVTTIVVNSWTDKKATVLSGFGGADDTDGTNYYLVETKAPAGYNKLTSPIIVNVKDNGTISVKIGSDDPVATAAFNVENNTGTVLPSTGGIGTTIFYIIGGALVVGAIVTLVTRRNMSK